MLIFLFIGKKGNDNYSIVKCALAAGIGFSILENCNYLTAILQSGASGAAAFMVVRSLSAALLHGVLTALTGYSVQQMVIYRFRSLSLLAGTWCLAVSIHSAFNFLAQIEELKMLCLLIPATMFAPGNPGMEPLRKESLGSAQ